MTNKDENNQENKTEQPISLILEDKSNLFVESLSNIYRTFMSEESKEASVVSNTEEKSETNEALEFHSIFENYGIYRSK